MPTERGHLLKGALLGHKDGVPAERIIHDDDYNEVRREPTGEYYCERCLADLPAPTSKPPTTP